MSISWRKISDLGLAGWQGFRRIVYERIEVSSVRRPVERKAEERGRSFKVLGIEFALGRNIFSVSGRLVSELRVKSTDLENNGSGTKMLRGLSSTGFEGMFTVSYEPFNYEVRFSIASGSLKGLNTMVPRLKASILAGYPHAELEWLKPSSDTVLWPLGGFPISRHGNTLILLRGKNVSVASFLLMKLKDSMLSILENGFENSLRSSAESGCSLRFCIPVKSCRGVLHALGLWAKRRSLSTQYSKAYRKLRESGIFNSRGVLIGSDLKRSTELEFLRSQYERLNSQSGCWICSPIIVVIGPPAKNPKQAYAEQRSHVEAVKASFSSSYGVRLEEAGWLSLREVARSMLTRRIVSSNRLHLTSDELSFFISLPKPITPSFSYMPKRVVEFEAFDPTELQKNGILLGYYESMGRRLEVKIGVKDLPLHLAIFGVPGSGKTTLAKALLKRYGELGGTAMVFDRHGEYVDELDAMVLSPENTRISLLQHNGDPEAHAKALSEVFSMAWPDEFGPLVSHIFRKMYLKYLGEDDNPSLTGFVTFLERSLGSDDFTLLRSGKARDKLFSLVGRLSELTQGEMGRMFNASGGNETRLEKLLSRTIVFNLTGLDTDRD
ncbi:MAG: DUF87 domain-containing protein, partial [Thermoproteota archaeon]